MTISSVPAIAPDWIAVDWGTSNLRAWAMGPENTVLARSESTDGMGSLAPDAFEAALLAVVEPWLSDGYCTPVLACGMVGARQGWVEAPYRRVPVSPVGGALTTAPTNDPRLAVSIVPGLSQSEPPDVMRGEETQIAGYVALHGSEGTLCLPGTHSKWVRFKDGVVTRFATTMTGEIFSLLSGQSVLRHSMGEDGWDDAAFDRGVTAGLAGNALAQLFSIRAASLLSSLPPETSRARLSGLLIGAELAGANSYWQGHTIVLIGASKLAALYQRALKLAGGRAEIADADSLTLAGLIAAHNGWKETA